VTAMNVVPLCIGNVAYYSNHAAQYLQNLINTVDALPFLQQLIDELTPRLDLLRSQSQSPRVWQYCHAP
jgi:hypothetical protein